jgi:hypothetical protein
MALLLSKPQPMDICPSFHNFFEEQPEVYIWNGYIHVSKFKHFLVISVPQWYTKARSQATSGKQAF